MIESKRLSAVAAVTQKFRALRRDAIEQPLEFCDVPEKTDEKRLWRIEGDALDYIRVHADVLRVAGKKEEVIREQIVIKGISSSLRDCIFR